MRFAASSTKKMKSARMGQPKPNLHFFFGHLIAQSYWIQPTLFGYWMCWIVAHWWCQALHIWSAVGIFATAESCSEQGHEQDMSSKKDYRNAVTHKLFCRHPRMVYLYIRACYMIRNYHTYTYRYRYYIIINIYIYNCGYIIQDAWCSHSYIQIDNYRQVMMK